MKNWVLTILFALAASALSFGAFYTLNRHNSEVRSAARAGDALEWLRVDFKLSDAQYAQVKQLHDDYGVVCGEHCMAIMRAEKRGAPRVEVAALERECVESMTAHFRRVASVMSPEQGERYLKIVLPRVSDYDHRGAPNLGGRR